MLQARRPLPCRGPRAASRRDVPARLHRRLRRRTGCAPSLTVRPQQHLRRPRAAFPAGWASNTWRRRLPRSAASSRCSAARPPSIGLLIGSRYYRCMQESVPDRHAARRAREDRDARRSRTSPRTIARSNPQGERLCGMHAQGLSAARPRARCSRRPRVTDTVLVTGSSRGIGRAIALRLARAGFAWSCMGARPRRRWMKPSRGDHCRPARRPGPSTSTWPTAKRRPPRSAPTSREWALLRRRVQCRHHARRRVPGAHRRGLGPGAQHQPRLVSIT